MICSLFALVGFYLMGAFTVFVLLHVGVVVVCASVWFWGQRRTAGRQGADLLSFFWPRRLLWVGAVLVLLTGFTMAGKRVWLDLTPDHAFSLTAASLAVLGDLLQPVEALVALPGRRSAEAWALLERYHRASALIQLRKAGEIGSGRPIPPLPADGVLLRTDERQEFLSVVTEETITNALVRLSEERKRVVYVLAGHGEPALDDTEPAGFAGLARVLGRARYDVRRLLLVSADAVPSDTDLLIIPSGSKTPLAEEQAAISHYLRTGGAGLFFLATEQATVWETLLGEFGIVWEKQWISQRVAARTVKNHPLAPAVPRNSVALLSGFFPLKVWGRVPDGAAVQPVLVSDESERLSPTLVAAHAPGQGFLIFGITGEYPVTGSQAKTRMVVFGGQSVATNGGFSLLANQELVTGSIQWLTRGEPLVRIAPRVRVPAQMIIAPESLEQTFVFLVLLPPELFLLAGVIGLGVKGRL